MTDRLHRALLALYPRAWRARYGRELADLVADLRADGAAPSRITVDLVRAAGVERLRAAEVLGAAPAAARARGGSLLVLWAWMLFVLAGCTVAKFAEHWSDTVAGDERRVAAAAFAVLVGAALCTAALVAAGLASAAPGLVRGLRSGLWPRLRRPVTVAAGLSAAMVLATAGLVTRAADLTVRQRNGQDLAYAGAFLAWAGLGATCLVAWTVVATTAARGIELPDRVLRLQARLGAGVTLGMAVMTAATLTWSVARAEPGSWAVVTAAMVVATTLAVIGSGRSLHAIPDLAG
jgi:hypothetical protein